MSEEWLQPAATYTNKSAFSSIHSCICLLVVVDLYSLSSSLESMYSSYIHYTFTHMKHIMKPALYRHSIVHGIHVQCTHHIHRVTQYTFSYETIFFIHITLLAGVYSLLLLYSYYSILCLIFISVMLVRCSNKRNEMDKKKINGNNNI